MAAVLSLAACTPAGRAVGDTQASMPEVAHDSTHPTDVTVGFVGSTDTAADEFVTLDRIRSAGIPLDYNAAYDELVLGPDRG